MALSKNGKLALLAAAAAGGLFLFMKDSKADEVSADPADTLGDAAGCAAGTSDAKANRPKATTAQMSALASAAFAGSGLTSAQMVSFANSFAMAYERCYNENKVTPIPGGGGGGTIVFNPLTMKDKVRAQSLAYAIAHSPPVGKEPGCEDTLSYTGRSYCTLADFASYGPNASALAAFQEAAGITPDGKYGLQTQRAFNYFFPG